MGRIVKRIDNLSSRQAAYGNRKDVMIKKANELSVLCDTDVALLMFSSDGQLTTFASKDGRVEDIFLRFLKHPNELKGGPVLNEEYLTSKMEHSKNEAVMIEKMEKLEVLQDTLHKLNLRQYEAQERMRLYNPDVENITSLVEVGAYQKFLENALERIDDSKEKLFLAEIENESDDISEDAESDRGVSPNADDHECSESNTKNN